MAQHRATTTRALLVALGVGLLAAAPSDAAKNKKASDYFTLCRRGDPDLAGCVKRSIETAKPQLLKGIPELKMPPFDPMQIPGMELREGQGNFLFVLKLKNMTIQGLKDFVIRKAETDIRRGTWRVDMLTPEMLFEADYEMSGRILALPISGNGISTFHFHNVSTVCNIQQRNVTRGGKVYAEIVSLKWTINVEGARSNFTNLFNGDKTLGETTNRFLNDNWRDAFETYKHLPEEAFGLFFTDLNNRFFEQFSLDELYPE